MNNLQKWLLIGAVGGLAIGLFKIGVSLQKGKLAFIKPVANRVSSREDLELQAMCAKRVEEYYKEHPQNNLIFRYTWHYNKKLNKCFIKMRDFERIGDTAHDFDEVSEVYENKSYASYQQDMSNGQHLYDTRPTDCKVLGQNCKSKAEYESLVKPLMEE